MAETVREARALAGKVQGRSTSLPLRHPLEQDHHIGEILAVLQQVELRDATGS